jgi:hypothetical protein
MRRGPVLCGNYPDLGSNNNGIAAARRDMAGIRVYRASVLGDLGHGLASWISISLRARLTGPEWMGDRERVAAVAKFLSQWRPG